MASLASGLMLYAAFPPLGLWPLAWIAPIGWLVVVRRPEPGGNRPYLGIWLAGWLHWALLLQGIRLAHPALNLGWLVLTGYLSVYFVLFVALSRVAVHRWRIPLALAAPVVWVGLELARGQFAIGFSASLLAHSQIRWNDILQIADIAGGYGVSFLMMMTASGLVTAFDPAGAGSRRGPSRYVPIAAAVVLIGAALYYGHHRGHVGSTTDATTLKVALLQNSIETIFEHNPDRSRESFRKHWEQTIEVSAEHPDLDLIVWPESVFNVEGLPYLLREEQIQVQPDADVSEAEYERLLDLRIQEYAQRLRENAQWIRDPRVAGPDSRIHLIVGTETRHFGPFPLRRFNSALLVSPDGRVDDVYHKVHRVMFGEYLPLGDFFPWLYAMTPMRQGGLTPGSEYRCFQVKGTGLTPTICFESTVPQLVRRQIEALHDDGTPAGVIVNLTNDGWFRDSSILDIHLACGVLRAIENRKPVLIAANQGITAAIDRRGRVIARAPKGREETLVVDIHPDDSLTPYHRTGDVPAGVCLAICVLLALDPAFRRGSRRIRR